MQFLIHGSLRRYKHTQRRDAQYQQNDENDRQHDRGSMPSVQQFQLICQGRPASRDGFVVEIAFDVLTQLDR